MQIKCSRCSTTLNVGADSAGKKVRCPKCDAVLAVPAAGLTGASASSGTRQSPATPQTAATPTGGTIKATCPHCAKQLEVSQAAVGKQVKCPACSKPFPVGAASGAAAGAPARVNGAAAASSAATDWVPPWEDQTPKFAQSFVDELTEADMSPMRAVNKPGAEVVKSLSNSEQQVLQSAANEDQREKATAHTQFMKDAKKQIWQSIGIYVSLGAIQLVLGLLFLFNIEKEAEYLALDGVEGIEDLINGARICYVLMTCLGVCFFLAAGCFMTLPLTSSIPAVVLFVIAEILSMYLNPVNLISPGAWVRRVVVLGGLLQAINNASYYRFVRGGGRDRDNSAASAARRKDGNKFGQKETTVAALAAIALLGMFGGAGFYLKRSFDQPLPEIVKLDSSAPEGFDTYTVNGVSVYLPQARPIQPTPGVIESKGVITTLGTIFVAGVAEIDQEVNGDALKAVVERVTGGEYRSIGTVQRDGHQGEKGVLTKATRFAAGELRKAPMLNVEVYQDDYRLIIIGVAQEVSDSSNTVVGKSAEPEKEQIFRDSLKIRDKPRRSFWFF
ncbi:MAG: hypothetical protein AAF802_06190 [Planctomycetota bacterium]